MNHISKFASPSVVDLKQDLKSKGLDTNGRRNELSHAAKVEQDQKQKQAQQQSKKIIPKTQKENNSNVDSDDEVDVEGIGEEEREKSIGKLKEIQHLKKIHQNQMK